MSKGRKVLTAALAAAGLAAATAPALAEGMCSWSKQQTVAAPSGQTSQPTTTASTGKTATGG